MAAVKVNFTWSNMSQLLIQFPVLFLLILIALVNQASLADTKDAKSEEIAKIEKELREIIPKVFAKQAAIDELFYENRTFSIAMSGGLYLGAATIVFGAFQSSTEGRTACKKELSSLRIVNFAFAGVAGVRFGVMAWLGRQMFADPWHDPRRKKLADELWDLQDERDSIIYRLMEAGMEEEEVDKLVRRLSGERIWRLE